MKTKEFFDLARNYNEACIQPWLSSLMTVSRSFRLGAGKPTIVGPYSG